MRDVTVSDLIKSINLYIKSNPKTNPNPNPNPIKVKLWIAGPRDLIINDTTFDNLISNVISINSINLIIDGAAKGIDSCAAKFAERHNIPRRKFSPNWAEFGYSAGPIRNELMGEIATHGLIIKRKNQSTKGTTNALKIMKKKRILVKIIEI